MHLFKIGDPRGFEWLTEFRTEFHKAMFDMLSASPLLAPLFNDTAESTIQAIDEMFDKAVLEYCARTPPDFIPYATALGDIWEDVTRRCGALLVEAVRQAEADPEAGTQMIAI